LYYTVSYTVCLKSSSKTANIHTGKIMPVLMTTISHHHPRNNTYQKSNYSSYQQHQVSIAIKFPLWQLQGIMPLLNERLHIICIVFATAKICNQIIVLCQQAACDATREEFNYTDSTWLSSDI